MIPSLRESELSAMGYIFSCLIRVWRRKIAVVGLTGGLLVFLICANYSGYGKSKVALSGTRQVQGSKKLQQTHDPENTYVDAVQFIPGVPGHSVKRVPKQEKNEPSENEEARYYAAKNKALFNAQAKAAREKAKLHMYKPVPRNEPPPQPMGDENAEYEREENRPNNVYFPQKVQGGLGHVEQIQELSNYEGSAEIPLYIPQQRLVHLDLKGAPPKVEYIKKVLPIFKQLGATGLLIEWEDMFPWKGRLASVAATNHYTLADVKEILAASRALGLEVIPLVQTFGHLEFVLKHQQFQHLRDVAEMPESLCPCHNETMQLVRDIIDQVMAVHRDAKYLHIGCDEVFHLGECEPCQGSSRTSTFVQHVTNVATYTARQYRVTPIIWDDMLRNMMPDEMMPLADIVEPMVWVYAEDVSRFVPSYTWDRYSQVFQYFWTASAFKGAHGETLVVPPVKRHLENNINWLQLMSQEESKLRGGFRGIVITGWQRYDHFAVLCELLPAGLPALGVSLLATTHGYFNDSLTAPLYKAMQCVETPKYRNNNGPLDLTRDKYLWDKLSWCFFPGAAFFKVTRSLDATKKEVAEYMDKVQVQKGWLTKYNVRHNFSSPFRVDEVLEDWSRYQHEVVLLMKSARDALDEVFDHYTQSEWIEQNIYPMYRDLSTIRNEADKLRKIQTWPKRPFPPLDALKGLGIGVPPTPESDSAKEVPQKTVRRKTNHDLDNF